ncbi:MAG: flagellar hook-basal body complex protein FliE [Spirochaetia bacterium]|jgi:flagellar hook-basal body complex protein FliE|nr:flagellar hook-basal body complex protein FliE [Spirochaetia bacterium]
MNADAIFTGNVVKMFTTDPLHYANDKKQGIPSDDVSTSFSQLLEGAVNKVNDLQIDAEQMQDTMIHSPASVDIHTVMLALQKAEVSFTFVKSVRDEAIRSYRELMNLR